MLGIRRKFIESCLLVMMLTSLFVLLSTRAAGQQPLAPPATKEAISRNTAAERKTPAQPSTVVAPVYKDFMGVTLGMNADVIREKLGHLKNKGEGQDFFVFSDSQTAQVVYDDDGKAITISVDYLKGAEAPTAESVLGEAVPAKTDGSMFQLKRYPEAGYWVAYSRTAGENPTITVTMQKI